MYRIGANFVSKICDNCKIYIAEFGTDSETWDLLINHKHLGPGDSSTQYTHLCNMCESNPIIRNSFRKRR